MIVLKFKQMEYALVVARTNSFSQAAKELFVSQPNISSAISALEDELGFKIFQRTNQGITITSEGFIFLEHASNIMAELDKIPTIIEKEPYRKFSIGCMFNHTVVTQAFLKLCTEFQSSCKLNFSMYSGSSRDIIDDVYTNKIELGIMLVNPIILDSYINTMSNKNLHFETIRKMNINVNLRNGHPLLEEKPFNFDKLNNYPFANYHYNVKSNFNVIAEYPDVLSLGIINFDKMINISERETRRQLVISTDAFSIGTSYHPDMEGIDEIVSIPIPNLEMSLVLVLKDNQPYSEELERFINLLKEELSVLKFEQYKKPRFLGG